MTEIRKFHLENLDCANCAAKIEEGVQKMPGVRFAKVNFATSSIHLDADNLKDVENKIREMEPEVRFRSTETPKTGLDAGAKRELTLIIISLVLFILGLVFDQWLDKWPYFSGQWVVFMVAYLVSGYRVLWRAVQNLNDRGYCDWRTSRSGWGDAVLPNWGVCSAARCEPISKHDPIINGCTA
jgi:Cd2+/Zn2+-exporting ATPase